MLVDEKAGEKTCGTSQEASKIFIYFILNSLDFFIEENVVSLFHWALFVLNFDFVSKKSVSLTKSKNSTSEHGKQYFFDEKVQRFQNKVYKYFAPSPYGESKLTRISFTASLQRKDR